ncbi:alpha/beta fold hydrolase [Streptomyces sp. NPDC055078]
MRDFVYHGSDGCRLHATALGQGPALILLHGGGADRHRLLPLARLLADGFTVVLADVRGYGRSVCAGHARHTGTQYTEDVDALLDQLGLRRATLGGTGPGGAVTLRVAAERPDRVRAALVIGVEGIGNDTAQRAGTATPQPSAARIREQGIHTTCGPLLPAPVPGTGPLVCAAPPRSHPVGIATARDRDSPRLGDLAAITVPTLVVADTDSPCPGALSAQAARALPHGHLARVPLTVGPLSADGLAPALAPAIWDFLVTHLTLHAAAPGRPWYQLPCHSHEVRSYHPE